MAKRTQSVLISSEKLVDLSLTTERIISKFQLIMSNTLKGVLLASFAGWCWGSMAVCAQYLFNSCGFISSDLTTLRLFGSGVSLLLLYALTTRQSIFLPFQDLRNLRDVFIYGLGVLLIQWTFFKAISVSNAGTAALMVGFGPLFIIFYFVITKGRKPSLKEMICLCLALTGVFLLVSKGNFKISDLSWGGCLWGLTSAACGAFCTVQPKQVIERAGVSFVVGWGMLIGGLIAMCFTSPFNDNAQWNFSSILAYAQIVLFGTVAAFWCYLKSTEYVLPSISAILGSFEPFSAVLLSVLFLNSSFNIYELIGGAAIVANMIILAWPQKTSDPA